MTEETTDMGAGNEGAPAAEESQGTTALTEETSTTTTQVVGEENTGESASDDTGDGGQETSPETYADFTMPEGVELNEALLAEATPVFQELGLNQEQAQKLVDLHAQQVQAGEVGQVEAYTQMMDDWREQSMNDKEFGGDKFEESVGIARAALDKFGTPELKELLEDHGVGNHPEVIRFMVNVGKLTAEDVPGSQASPTSQKGDRAERLYPNQS